MSTLLTIKEAAVRLQLSTAMVYSLCGHGQLPHVRLGLKRGTIRIREEDLAAFVESCRIEGGRRTNAPGLHDGKAQSAESA